MIAWMLYAVFIGALLALAGLAAERLLAGIRRPRRFAWLTVLTLAVVIPLVGGLRGPAETVGDANAAGPSHSQARSAQVWSAVPPLLLFSGPRSARIAAIAWGAASSSCLIAMIAFLVFVTRARLRWPRHRIDGAEVRLSRGFGPAVVGIIRPTVVIPSWVLDRDGAEQGTILRHELEHARERDHLVLLYAGLLAAAFPWSPAVWWMLRRLRAAVEMDCDRRVISSGIAAADYGRILVGAAARSRGRWGLAPAIGQPTSLLERRLMTMNGGQITLNRAHGTLLATVVMMALGIACDVPAPTQLDEAIGEVVANGRGDLPGARMPEMTLPTIHLPAFVLIDGERIPIPEARAAYWSNRMREAFRRRNYRITTVSEEEQLWTVVSAGGSGR